MTSTTKPFSQACENNKEPILDVLRQYLIEPMPLLELGSGTGQHAAHMSAHLPHIQWQTSDLVDQHDGIRLWIEDAGCSNILQPLELDVTDASWPVESVAAIYSANTAHIVSWPAVGSMFAGIGRVLSGDGLCFLYGPFNYDGNFTGEGNRRFDGFLKSNDPRSGIRDFEAINALADQHQLRLEADHEMPANNRLLVWRSYKRCDQRS